MIRFSPGSESFNIRGNAQIKISKMPSPGVYIFDFDGTLADTFAVAVTIFNQLSTEFGFRPVRDEELEATRKMSAKEVMVAHGISKTALPRIAARGLSMLHRRMGEVLPFEGIPGILHTLRERGHRLGILTSNSAENVQLFLDRNDLAIFDFVQPSSRLFGKARELRSLLKRNRWKPSEVLFVGDECRDIEAAHKVRIPVVGVTWGFNTPDALSALKPLALLNRPAELLCGFEPPGSNP